MLVLVVYDISCSTENGKKRLRKVAKYCESFGTRIQDSVFECLMDAAQFRLFKSTLVTMIVLLVTI